MTLLDEQIDFALLLIPVEPYVTKALPRVHKAFQYFRDNECLKYMPSRSPVSQLLRQSPPVMESITSHKRQPVKIGSHIPDFDPQPSARFLPRQGLGDSQVHGNQQSS